LELAGYSKHTTEQLVKIAINLAKEAREISGEETIIAGCNAPAEDCYQKERTVTAEKIRYNHQKHIETLWENGADIIRTHDIRNLRYLKKINELVNNPLIEEYD